MNWKSKGTEPLAERLTVGEIAPPRAPHMLDRHGPNALESKGTKTRYACTEIAFHFIHLGSFPFPQIMTSQASSWLINSSR